ncbi:MAG: DoxX family protein [Rhodothermales bacterium]
MLSSRNFDLGLLVIRLGMGLGFLYYHGWGKLMGGVERWTGLGESMQRFGIDFGAPFWGFMISFAESVGALLIAVGFLTAPMSWILAIGMFVAWTGHIASGQGTPGHAFKNMVVLIGIALSGPGRYSVDAWLRDRMTRSDQANAVVGEMNS